MTYLYVSEETGEIVEFDLPMNHEPPKGYKRYWGREAAPQIHFVGKDWSHVDIKRYDQDKINDKGY
jgi:hypothetical protein